MLQAKSTEKASFFVGFAARDYLPPTSRKYLKTFVFIQYVYFIVPKQYSVTDIYIVIAIY